jgi:hypothetical protein
MCTRKSIDLAVAEEGGEVRHHGQIGGDMNALWRAVRKLESSGRELVFVYEAGPCGFGIYRGLAALGHACWVVAPSNTPRRVRERRCARFRRWLRHGCRRKCSKSRRGGAQLPEVSPFIRLRDMLLEPFVPERRL